MSKRKYKNPGGPVRKLSQNDVVDRIQRNGITVKDLEYSYKEGYDTGKKEGVAVGMDSVYGSILIALHREFGFGAERLTRLVRAVTDIQIEEISSYSALETLMAETGVSLPMLQKLRDEVV